MVDSAYGMNHPSMAIAIDHNLHFFTYHLIYPLLHLNRDLERIEVPVYSVKGHSAIINTIDAIGGLGVGGGAPEIVTGSRDGKKEKSLVSLCFVLLDHACVK